MTTNLDELTATEQRQKLAAAERKGRKTVKKKTQQLQKLVIEYVAVADIKPNTYNPNRQSEHDFELLLRSMEEDGFTQPVLGVRVTEELQGDPSFSGYEIGDLVIVDGEHRWRAAQRLGFEEIPVAISPMTGEQIRISTLRHNRARGSEDIDLTAQVLRDLEALGAKEWALDSLMMSDLEMERLIEDVPAPQALANAEYAEGWEPDKAGTDIAPVEGREHVADSGTWTNASTAAAVEASRERERQLREAQSEEQRTMIARDMSKGFHRVSLLVYGADAEVVKKALHGAPAEALVALCRKEAGETDAALGEGWVTLDSVIGRRTIPAPAATVLKEAITKAKSRGDVSDKNEWQLLEYLSAEYLAGK